MNNGVLEEKLRDYYEDSNIINYRPIFMEAIYQYRGDKFNKILDIGAGIGTFLESVAPFGFGTYALEASKYGVKRLKSKDINVQEFYLEKDKQLPFDDNEFSLVLFNQVIEHLDKETGQYYIGEIIRVLEPGGVAIIKSPSKYCKIWRTDPHHIYCWKPNELFDEVQRYTGVTNLSLQRVPLVPWMFFRYNEKIINTWHKNNNYPNWSKLFNLFFRILDKALNKLTKSDKLLAVSNITFNKKK
ncbi:class I SAM-dependent methyltransferase [Francisella philomiragia]|uniref:class I SAM-dependent methyltransferase n=1 Tax=Francisella philomiragia TaxID=28110 RepID=UPI0005A56F8E|nr:class I SAM-dependent methyltransferase [Francisella philomiragia]AJI55953.1 methyltransferase domain protein [Francisella philomiragia]MBK2252128.1 class I SAM-dependent methyltransferase [Francisella philomiragia]MBK2267564.1 class I SAM-dependent methyltransferase [Francisella philomiragia]MBK2279020.1 class I SAM-dependent methyltransferase [Francisella philomiragia]MBK2286740.1 class I SAM-dependent methyltransferase [Francisella philomiragia]